MCEIRVMTFNVQGASWSYGWKSACVRSANWVKLYCVNSGVGFIHLNTHLDHVSKLAQVEGSKLILRRISQLRANIIPVIITGDFNNVPESSVYRVFTDGGFSDSYLDAGNEDSEDAYTRHALKGERYSPAQYGFSSSRIDWILTLDGLQSFQTKSCVIIRDAEPPLYPSDHYPVLSELLFIG